MYATWTEYSPGAVPIRLPLLAAYAPSRLGPEPHGP